MIEIFVHRRQDRWPSLEGRHSSRSRLEEVLSLVSKRSQELSLDQISAINRERPTARINKAESGPRINKAEWGLWSGVISLTLCGRQGLTLTPSAVDWLSHWEERLAALLAASETCIICFEPLITARRAQPCPTCKQSGFHWSCRRRCDFCPLCRRGK